MHLLHICFSQIAGILEGNSTISIFILQLFRFDKEECGHNNKRYDGQHTGKYSAQNTSIASGMWRNAIIESETKRFGKNTGT